MTKCRVSCCERLVMSVSRFELRETRLHADSTPPPAQQTFNVDRFCNIAQEHMTTKTWKRHWCTNFFSYLFLLNMLLRFRPYFHFYQLTYRRNLKLIFDTTYFDLSPPYPRLESAGSFTQQGAWSRRCCRLMENEGISGSELFHDSARIHFWFGGGGEGVAFQLHHLKRIRIIYWSGRSYSASSTRFSLCLVVSLSLEDSQFPRCTTKPLYAHAQF